MCSTQRRPSRALSVFAALRRPMCGGENRKSKNGCQATSGCNFRACGMLPWLPHQDFHHRNASGRIDRRCQPRPRWTDGPEPENQQGSVELPLGCAGGDADQLACEGVRMIVVLLWLLAVGMEFSGVATTIFQNWLWLSACTTTVILIVAERIRSDLVKRNSQDRSEP